MELRVLGKKDEDKDKQSARANNKSEENMQSTRKEEEEKRATQQPLHHCHHQSLVSSHPYASCIWGTKERQELWNRSDWASPIAKQSPTLKHSPTDHTHLSIQWKEKKEEARIRNKNKNWKRCQDCTLWIGSLFRKKFKKVKTGRDKAWKNKS